MLYRLTGRTVARGVTNRAITGRAPELPLAVARFTSGRDVRASQLELRGVVIEGQTWGLIERIGRRRALRQSGLRSQKKQRQKQHAGPDLARDFGDVGHDVLLGLLHFLTFRQLAVM